LLIYVAVLAALYTLVAIAWLVIPIADRFGGVFLGTAIFSPDTFLNAGILEWGFRAIRSPDLRLFDWTAGFPLSNSLAVTENLLGWQLLYTPLRLAGLGIQASYNVLLLTSLVVSGIGAALLTRRFGGDKAAGAVAGLIFGFGPFHLSHTLHLQTMAVCWSPFAILFLDRYLETRNPRDAVGLAASFIMSALSSIYFGVFLGIVLPLYAALCWISKRYRFDMRTFFGLAATGAVATVFLMPVISHYVQFSRAVGYHHSAQTLASFSMEAAALLRVPDWLALWSWSPSVRVSTFASALTFTSAFPGLVAVFLAGYAIVRGARDTTQRKSIVVLGSLVVVCYLLALGPLLKPINLNLAPGARWLPMPGKIWLLIPGVRWPMRIFFFSLLGGAVLSGLGLSFLRQKLSPQRARAAVVLALGLIVLESWPRRWFAGKSQTAGDPMSLSDAYPFLAAERDRGGIVELPISDRSGWRTPFSTRYVYASSGHLRRVVALHGSVTPPVTDTLIKSAIAAPDSAAMRTLASHNVTRLVLHLPLMTGAKGRWLADRLEKAGYPVIFAGREAVVFGTERTPSAR
jgi:hypothetical protein